jgi:hypothetical protein
VLALVDQFHFVAHGKPLASVKVDVGNHGHTKLPMDGPQLHLNGRSGLRPTRTTLLCRQIILHGDKVPRPSSGSADAMSGAPISPTP